MKEDAEPEAEPEVEAEPESISEKVKETLVPAFAGVVIPVVKPKKILKKVDNLAFLLRADVNEDQFEYPSPEPYISEAT